MFGADCHTSDQRTRAIGTLIYVNARFVAFWV